MTAVHTSVNEDVPLQMVVRPECSITVSADVTLWVLYTYRSIIINAEDLQAQRKQRHTGVFLLALHLSLWEILTHAQLRSFTKTLFLR